MLLIPHVAGGGEKVLSELTCNPGTDVTLVLFEERFSYPFAGRVICLNMPVDRGSLSAGIRQRLRIRCVQRQ